MFSNVDFKVPNKLENNLLEIYILCANVFCYNVCRKKKKLYHPMGGMYNTKKKR